jgi:dTDP-4-amino-4,6-dideoxygalactose transaminase
VIRSENRDTLREHLWKQGIETAVNYPKALPFYPAYARLGHNPGDFPNAHRNQNKILSLPIYPELSETQLEFVAEKLRDFR